MKIARVRLEDNTTAIAAIGDGTVTLLGADDVDLMLSVLLDPASARHGEVVAREKVTLLQPIERPPSVRDFMVFEEHVANARQRTGRDVPEAWYKAPAFYFTNPAALIGPDDPMPRPTGSRALDFELEVACIIGREASDLDPDDPATLDVIAGFMLMNDWSARDLQVAEMSVGLGPVKGKDFATSVGPWIVTKDELGDPTNGKWSCQVDVYVEGRHAGGADIASATFGWNEMVARASENTRLMPGDLLGTGTVGKGCLLELRELGYREDNPWLRDGDVVELRGGPLGVLRNTVVPSQRPAVQRSLSLT
jgi:fumarylacetoacetate (FAA) hydrolase